MLVVDLNSIENCRPIEGRPGYYVSADGRFWSMRTRRYGRIRDNGKVHQLATTSSRYPMIQFYENGIKTFKAAHLIMIETFVGPRPESQQCRHLDGNTKNFRLDNLAWGTNAENVNDKRTHGTLLHGGKHPRAKLDETAVVHIWERYNAGDSQAQIARDLGVTKYCISDIIRGKRWTHVLSSGCGSLAK